MKSPFLDRLRGDRHGIGMRADLCQTAERARRPMIVDERNVLGDQLIA